MHSWRPYPNSADPQDAWVRDVVATVLAAPTPWARMQLATSPPDEGMSYRPRRASLPSLGDLSPADAVVYARYMTTHHDGYLREPAVRWLGTHGCDAVDLDFLLPRLADYVLPVAATARYSVQRLLGRLPADALLDRLDAIGRLTERVRWDAAADGVVGQGLCGELDALRARLPAERPHGLRYGLRVLADMGVPVADRARLALGSADVRSAMAALDEVDREGDPSTAEEVLRLALGAAHGPVRAHAVRRWDQLDLPGGSSVLEAAVIDRARPVRWVGQHRLRKRGGDPVVVARAAVASRPAPGAIEALGETGDRSDLSTLEPLLDAAVRVAVAALRAIAAIDAEEGAGWAAALLLDGHPGVAREAASVLAGGLIPLSVDELVAVVLDPPHAHTARRALPLLARLSKFAALDGLLRVASVRPEAHEHLASWARKARGRSYSVRPSSDERARLLALLRDAGLPHDLTQQVRAGLGRPVGRSSPGSSAPTR